MNAINTMNAKRYSLPEPLVQAVINLLGVRPWHEVEAVMAGLRSEITQQDAAPPPPADPLPPIEPAQASASS